MGAVTRLAYATDPVGEWVWHDNSWVIRGHATALTPGRTVEVRNWDGTVVEREVGETVAWFADGTIAVRPSPFGPNARWHRLNGVWVLRGPNLVEGQQVVVRSARTGTEVVTVGHVVTHDGDTVYALPDPQVERPRHRHLTLV